MLLLFMALILLHAINIERKYGGEAAGQSFQLIRSLERPLSVFPKIFVGTRFKWLALGALGVKRGVHRILLKTCTGWIPFEFKSFFFLKI